MTHYVVETTLKIPNAFFSLVRAGWDIPAFAAKGVGATLPHEANLVEALVGRLQRDLMPGSGFTAESYNEEVEAVLVGIENPARRHVTGDELQRMRERLRELLSQWKALPPGESIFLEFPPQV
jgi:hypothetical protein